MLIATSSAIAVGFLPLSILAAVSYDLYNVILYFLFGISIDWHLIGRWFMHLATGNFIFRNIPQSTPMHYENLLGWLVHYGIAIVYSALYILLSVYVFRIRPRWYTAVIFSWAFMLVPFLVLQPAMGLGYFGSQAASQSLDCLTTFSFHTVFGLGIYFGYRIMLRANKISLMIR